VFGMLAMLLDITIAVPMTLMQARTESLLYSCVSFAMFLFRVIAIIITVVVFHWGIWGILGATALTSLLFGGVLTWRELARGSIRLDWTRLVAMLRFAAPFIPTGLFFFAFRSTDRFLLQKYAGLEAVGIYALGYRIASIVGAFTIAPLHQVWSARMFAAFELPNAASYFGRVFTRMLAAYTLAGMGFVIFADEVIRLLSPDEYFDAALVVAPMVLAFFFLNAANLMDAAFYVRHRTSLKPWITGSATAVAIGLYVWLVPEYGEMGAAYANLAAFSFLALATWAVSQNIFRVKYERLRLAGMLLSAFGVVFLSQAIPWGHWAIPVKLLLWMSWPVLMWLTGLVSGEEKELLLSGFWMVITEGRKLYSRMVA
jgi:O-antigen/teichoic acid export membrane protein